MSAVCPACGVAVVPGYVRCPKCHAALPYGAGRPRTGNTMQPAGGTTVSGKAGFPILPILAGVVVTAVIILFFSLRGGNDDKAARTAPAPMATERTPQAPVASPSLPQATNPTVPTASQTPAPSLVAADLERALKRQRLWSTLEVAGDRLDIRSGSCADPNLMPMVDAAAAALRNSGLTRLRCLEQSGRVAFERDL